MSFLRGAFFTCPHQIANHFILISDLQAWYHLQISVYFPFHHQKYWTVLDSEQTSASQFPKKSFVTTLNVDFQPYKSALPSSPYFLRALQEGHVYQWKKSCQEHCDFWTKFLPNSKCPRLCIPHIIMPEALKGVKKSFCAFHTLFIGMMDGRSTRRINSEGTWWEILIKWHGRVRYLTFQKMFSHSLLHLGEGCFQIWALSEGVPIKTFLHFCQRTSHGHFKASTNFQETSFRSVSYYHVKRCFFFFAQ